ncbi:MAG: sigma-70 family RNA polymerase sigma factor [Bacteroidetes bacterium]|nr:sigma-70 family RNA polymerase sigma factor [Fibrella sp.]
MTDNFRMLFRYGTRFSRDKEFIKDCIQDVFLYLWEHRSSLRADVAIKPYLMVSLRRHMHRNGSNAAFSDEFSEDKAEPFELTFSVEEHYIQQETSAKRVQRMKQLLEKLPRRQKEVIYLKFFQELDRDQIAAVMAIAPQTVSNLMQLAIKQLRQYSSVELLVLVLLQSGFSKVLTQLVTLLSP